MSILRKVLVPICQVIWKVASFKWRLGRALPQVQNVPQTSCPVTVQPANLVVLRFLCWEKTPSKLMASPPKNHKVTTLRVLEQDHAICNRHLMWKARSGLPQGPRKHGLYEHGHQLTMWPELSIVSWALSYPLSLKLQPTQHQSFAR